MMKVCIRTALIIAIIFVVIGVSFKYHKVEGSDWVRIGPAMDAIGLIVYVTVVFGASFSLWFTILLGIGLVIRCKGSKANGQNELGVFFASLVPFALSLRFFLWILQSTIHDHHR